MPTTRVSWIVAAILAVGLAAALVGWRGAVNAQKAAEAEMEAAASARAEAETAAKRAAAAKSQVDAEFARTKGECEQAASEVKDLREQKASLTAARAKLESYLGQQLRAIDDQKLPPDEDDVVPVAAKPARAGEWAVTPLLPSETIAAVTVCDSQQAIEKLKQTGLWRIYSDPDVQRAFRAPLLMAKAAIAAAEVQGDFKLDNILSFLSQGEITLALLALDKKMPQGQPLPEILLSIQARDTAPAVMEEINKRLDQLKAAAGGQLVVTQTPVGNTNINTVVVPVPDQAIGQISINYALCDGNIIVAFGEGRLQKLLAMREKYKAGVPRPAEGQAPEVLAQVPAYQKALEKGGPDASLVAYLNVEQLLKSQAVDVKPKTDRQRQEWETVGLDGVSAISYTVGIRKRGIREVAFIHVPVARRHGLLGLIEGEGLGIESMGAAPRSAIAAVALKISPERILDKLTELATLDNPNAKEELNSWLLMAGQHLGNLDLRKEVFSALTGQATFSISIATRHPKIPVGFPQPLLSLGVKDATALKNVLRALRDAGKDNWDFSEVSCGEKEIVTLRERFPQGGNPRQLCYVLDKNELIVSLYPLALRQELDRRAAAAKAPNEAEAALAVLNRSLAAEPDFRAARKGIKGVPQALLYLDTGALAVAAYDVLIPVAQIAARTPQVDVSSLPTSDLLLQTLGGTVFGFSTDVDGIVAEGYSPAGGISVLMMAPAAWQARRMANRVGQGPRGGARPQDAAEALGRSLRQFAAENGGKYPATLKDLPAKDTANLGDLNNIVYLGKQDLGNKVVAHSSEKLPGPITILTQDGTVAQIRRSQLGKVLQEGFKGDALPGPPPGRGDAVKPPRPPEF